MSETRHLPPPTAVPAPAAAPDSSARRGDEGQSTAEYAIVMVGVGALATFVFRWLQGSGLLERLFGEVIGQLLQR